MLIDDFNGDDQHLVACLEALVALDAKGALVPHGLGGRGSHASKLLSAAAVRLAARAESTSELLKALRPFAAVAELMRPLGAFESWPDDKPNHSFTPGLWPCWADFRKAAVAYASAVARAKAHPRPKAADGKDPQP